MTGLMLPSIMAALLVGLILMPATGVVRFDRRGLGTLDLGFAAKNSHPIRRVLAFVPLEFYLVLALGAVLVAAILIASGESHHVAPLLAAGPLSLVEERYLSISQAERDKVPAEDFAGPHQSFPIRNQDDVENAARLVGHADNPTAVKAAIIRIVKRKGLSLPESWQGEERAAGVWDEHKHPRNRGKFSHSAGDHSGGSRFSRSQRGPKKEFRIRVSHSGGEETYTIHATTLAGAKFDALTQARKDWPFASGFQAEHEDGEHRHGEDRAAAGDRPGHPFRGNQYSKRQVARTASMDAADIDKHPDSEVAFKEAERAMWETHTMSRIVAHSNAAQHHAKRMEQLPTESLAYRVHSDAYDAHAEALRDLSDTIHRSPSRLQSQARSRMRMRHAAGDRPGHPFRGNQYTHEGAAELHTRAAHLNRLAARPSMGHDHTGEKEAREYERSRKAAQASQDAARYSYELEDGEHADHASDAESLATHGDHAGASRAHTKAAESHRRLMTRAAEDGDEDFREIASLASFNGVKPKTVLHEGRQHYEVPVIALREGVIRAVNAPTKEFVSRRLLAAAAQSFVGVPLVLGHPTDAQGKQISAQNRRVLAERGFGVVKAATMLDDGQRMLLTTLVDPERLRVLKREDVLAQVENGEPIEVSIGAANVHLDRTAGTHNGVTYMSEWATLSGDHLAFLPDGKGACSLEMGCGACRAAAAYAGPMPDKAQVMEETDVDEDYCPDCGAALDANGDCPQCDTCPECGQMLDADGDCPMCDSDMDNEDERRHAGRYGSMGRNLPAVPRGHDTYGSAIRGGRWDESKHPRQRGKFAAKQAAMTSAVAHSASAQAISKEYGEALHDALSKYGEKGPWISGVGQDHFPADVKDKLRKLAQGLTEANDAAVSSYRQTGKRRPVSVHFTSGGALGHGHYYGVANFRVAEDWDDNGSDGMNGRFAVGWDESKHPRRRGKFTRGGGPNIEPGSDADWRDERFGRSDERNPIKREEAQGVRKDRMFEQEKEQLPQTRARRNMIKYNVDIYDMSTEADVDTAGSYSGQSHPADQRAIAEGLKARGWKEHETATGYVLHHPSRNVQVRVEPHGMKSARIHFERRTDRRSAEDINNRSGETPMTKEQRTKAIESIRACGCYTKPEDIKALEALTDEALTDKLAEELAKANADKTKLDAEKRALEQQRIEPAELANLRSLAAEREAADKAEATDLVAKLAALKIPGQTEADLKTRSLSDLRALAAFAKVDTKPETPGTTDFSAIGLPVTRRAAAAGRNFDAPDPYKAGIDTMRKTH